MEYGEAYCLQKLNEAKNEFFPKLTYPQIIKKVQEEIEGDNYPKVVNVKDSYGGYSSVLIDKAPYAYLGRAVKRFKEANYL